ncbi:hypothetical protein FF36_01660 [Frankia torreyi]|uniref:Uncharacterized protein n=1 Tax=Frankia torreyi TaxID=1856 RepID=A0A0D8BKP2_9ACTN|nr:MULTISPECIES: hypothetical protein [Frankia]KJE23972.1 hypothetical protein FF36_01660 [Frankia torreyi]KQC38756.1 hypothetical protein UK82_08180 [Frankia sp. ACN1ag]KQM07387.1 hypothetical protein FF86_100379 [Frankia sp. CpI1-P]
MTLGLSVFLVVAGATLRYALTWRVVGVDLPVLGLILMVAGIVTSVICVLRAVVPLPTRAAARERGADLRGWSADADGRGQASDWPLRRTIPLTDGRRGGTARPASADSLTVPDVPGVAAPFPGADADADALEFREPYPDLTQRPYLTLEQHVFGDRDEAEPAEPRDEAGI